MRTRRVRSSLARSGFAGFCFPPEVIVLAVRWSCASCCRPARSRSSWPSAAFEVDLTTVYRWVQRFTPLLAEAARPCRHAVGNRWHVDETYVKVAGRWRCVFRAIDQFGQVIDVFVSAQRDGRAARRFFEHAIGTTKARPMEVVTDLAVEEPVARGLAVAFDELPWRSDPSAGNGFGMPPVDQMQQRPPACFLQHAGT